MRIGFEYIDEDDDDNDGIIEYHLDGSTTIVSADEDTTTSLQPMPALQVSSENVKSSNGGPSEQSSLEEITAKRKEFNDDGRASPMKSVPTIGTPKPFQFAPSQQEVHQQSGPAASKNFLPPNRAKGCHYRRGQFKFIRRPRARKPPPWRSRLLSAAYCSN